MFRSPPQPMWDLTIYPSSGPSVLSGPTSLMTRRPVSGSDTICNGPSPPLADIVLFGLFLSSLRLLWRGFHTLIKNASFSSPTDVGSHNLPLFDAQRPRWHSFPSPINVGPPIHALSNPASLMAHRSVSGSDTICNNPSPPLGDIVLFGLSLSGLHLLGRGFYTLIKNVSFSSPTNVGSHTLWVCLSIAALHQFS